MNFSFSGFLAKILNWLRPSPGNDAPEIILPQLDGHVNEGDSTEALSAGGQVRFLDRDLHDSHVAQAEFISTSNPAGVEYGAFEAVVTRAPLLLRSGVVDWEFVVNDADIQFLAQGEVIEQTYRVAVVDAAGAQDSRDVLVRLVGTNDAPVVEAVALLAESDGGPIDGAFAGDDVDSDDDAASLIYEITDAPADGLVINNGDGTFSFDPRGDFSDLAEGETRDVTVGYRAIDSNGAVSEDNWITVTVRGAGTTDPTLPLANPDTNAGDPVTEAGFDPATGAPAGDATATGNVLDNDQGVGKFVVGVIAGAAAGPQAGGVGTAVAGTFGALMLGDDGLWTYTLDDFNPATEALAPGQAASDVFTYTMQDDTGATSTTTIVIAITGSADPAAPVPPRAVVDVNTDDAVIEAGIDANGDPIAGDANAAGNVLGNDEGTALTVIGVGAGPGIAAIAGGVGDVIQGTYGTLVLGDDGEWTYQLDDSSPATNALGAGQQATDVFGYTMQDAAGQTSTTTLFIVVGGSPDEAAVNNPPTANPDSNDGDPVVEAGIDPVTGDIIPGDPDATGNVLANDTDPDTGDTLAVSGIVAGVSTAILSNGTANPIEGVYGTLTMTPDGDWSYQLDNTRPETEALAQGQPATDVFTYTVVDGAGAASTTTLSVVVTGTADGGTVNNPPVGELIPDQTIDEDASFSFTIPPFVDPEGGVVTLSASLTGGDPLPGWLSFDPDTGAFAGTPDDPDVGTIDIVVRGTDPLGAFTEQLFRLTVTPVNDDPVANPDAISTLEGVPVQLNLLANDTDADGDPLTLVSVQPSNGQAVLVDTDGDLIVDGIEFTPDAGFVGETTITYDIEDGNGGTATGTATVTVGVNQPPIAVDDTYSVVENGTVVLDLLANDGDPEGEPVTLVRIDGQDVDVGVPILLDSGGLVTLDTDGTLLFDPNGQFDLLPGESVPVGFDYEIADAAGNFALGNVEVTILGNQSPIAVEDQFTVALNGTVSIDLLANDSDPENDPLTLLRIEGQDIALGDTLVLNSGALVTLTGVGTVLLDVSGITAGPLSFDYEVIDSDGNGGSALVQGTVLPPNEAPLVADAIMLPAAVEESLFLFVVPDGTFFDPDGDPLEISVSRGDGSALPAWLSFDPVSLTLSGSPDDPDVGPIDIRFRATDPAGAFVDEVVTLNVMAVDDAPVAVDDAAVTAADTPIIIDVLANDFDVDGPSVVIVDFVQPAGGRVTPIDNDSDGFIDAFEYRPDPGFTGVDTFTYEVEGGLIPATVTVTVGGVGDLAPVLTGLDGAPLAYVENDGPVPVADLISIADADSLEISSATVRIEGYVEGEDELSVLLPAGIAGEFNSVTGDLVLSAPSPLPLATFEAALRLVTYQNTSENPSVAPRTLSFFVTDAEGNTSDAVTRTIEITRVNDAPTLMAVDNFATVATEGFPVTVYPGLVQLDASAGEPGQVLTGLTLQVENVADGRDEILVIDGVGVMLEDGSRSINDMLATVSVVSGTATIQLSGATLSETALEAVLQSISYVNTSPSPTGGVRNVTLTSLTDSGGAVNAALSVTSAIVVAPSAAVGPSGPPPLVTTEQGAVYVLDRADFSPLIGTSDFAGVAFDLADTDGDGVTDYLDQDPQNADLSGFGLNGVLFLDRNGNDIAEDSEIINVNAQVVVTADQLDGGLLKFAPGPDGAFGTTAVAIRVIDSDAVVSEFLTLEVIPGEIGVPAGGTGETPGDGGATAPSGEGTATDVPSGTAPGGIEEPAPAGAEPVAGAVAVDTTGSTVGEGALALSEDADATAVALDEGAAGVLTWNADVATLDAPLVVAMPPLEAETALAPDLEMVSVEEELIATADLGFVLPAVESVELVELGAQLDTGIAGALHAAIDSIQANAAGGPLAESVVSVLQSLAARLDEPDNAVLGWLDDLLAGDGIGPVAGLPGLDGGAAYTLQDFMTEQPLLPAVITADDDLLVS